MKWRVRGRSRVGAEKQDPEVTVSASRGEVWGARLGQEGRQGWGRHCSSGVSMGASVGVRVRVTVGAAPGSLWSHVWGQGLRSVLDTKLSLDPCLWPLLSARGAAGGLPVPPGRCPAQGPVGYRGGPGWRLAAGHWHPPWEPGAAPAGASTCSWSSHSPDNWEGLGWSFPCCHAGSCTSSSGSIPSSLSGRFHNPDPRSYKDCCSPLCCFFGIFLEGEAGLQLHCFWFAKGRGTACPDPTEQPHGRVGSLWAGSPLFACWALAHPKSPSCAVLSLC